MERTRFSHLAHRTHGLCNPISVAKIDRLIAEARLSKGDRVIDFGAGKAELLCRLVERCGVTGDAIDTAGLFLEEGRKRAAGRVAEGSIRFHESDAKAWLAANEDARFELACCVGSTHAFGDLCGTIEALKSCVLSGGLMLIGEGYWQRSPDAAYLEFLGATEADYRSHEGNVRAGLEAGLIPMWACTASPDDWDEYEWRYSSAIERFALDHPGDPDRSAMLARVRSWLAGYLRHGRETLGFGLYLFCTP